MITVLTPAYNRAYILNNLYKSLCLQSDRDFEWIIVADGSSDNTETIVKYWIRENTLFPIRYFKQENGGKHRALNNLTLFLSSKEKNSSGRALSGTD